MEQVFPPMKPDTLWFHLTPESLSTGVRDYIHVMDLASGHVAALAKIEKDHLRYRTFNLGSGVGVSVLQLVKAFGEVTGTVVPYEIKPRREGDICAMYANGTRAKNELGWVPRYNLEQMCKSPC